MFMEILDEVAWNIMEISKSVKIDNPKLSRQLDNEFIKLRELYNDLCSLERN